MGPATRRMLELVVLKYKIPKVGRLTASDENQTHDWIPTPRINENLSRSLKRTTTGGASDFLCSFLSPLRNEQI